ncbi:hypothetical protein M2131_000862 [Polynucleobacter sphagniphilus]|uniref:hypothetical protein n=1 Tax=Polynucleobacter sphagniphilus TaxID=1743169 RepID=UPI0024730EBF|nr:hypothetical protein [Polynucleobacter sphagniphilus]MDH6420921.1 hypothetical protein [Polynucleobacter sphagniphilus]
MIVELIRSYRSQLINKSWVIALLLPILYLITNPEYFNQDDNFSQFTPVFKYAFEAMLRGEFPWMHLGELNVRVAESPYYAIFSPILFLCFAITQIFHLAPCWIINLWSLIFFTVISFLLLKFAKAFSIPIRMQGLLVLCAGVGSFMGQFSVNWYYTLPMQLLMIAKIYYWQYFLIHKKSSRANDCLILITTYLAVFGGNPQLFLYVQVVEFLFLLPLFNKRLFRIYLRNQIIALLLLAPLIYCQLEYWGHAWRSINNPRKTEIYNFLRSGIFNNRSSEGQSIWAIGCLISLFVIFRQFLKGESIKLLWVSLSITSIFLLLFSSIDLGKEFGGHISALMLLTTPKKWWFFGGITSVFAVCLWSKSWNTKIQTYFCIFALLSTGIYLIHNWGYSAYKWNNIDYEKVNSSLGTIKQFSDGNSRILQVTNFRNLDPDPSAHLILNTWLAGNYEGLVFAKGYETIQANENRHKDLVNYFEPQNLSYQQYQKLGVSTLWVNKHEYSKALFPPPDYQIAYEDQDHLLIRLKEPGKIVTCEQTNCAASIDFHPNQVSIHVDNFSLNDTVRVKITPYTNFSIVASGQKIPYFICDDSWLCFKPIENINAYLIEYHDLPFILLLLASNALFLILILVNQRWSQIRN